MRISDWSSDVCSSDLIKASEATGYGSLDGLLSVTLSLLFWMVLLFSALTLSSPSADDESTDQTDVRRGVPPDGALPVTTHATAIPIDSHHPSWVSSANHGHLPVSRATYSAPGSGKPRSAERRGGKGGGSTGRSR